MHHRLVSFFHYVRLFFHHVHRWASLEYSPLADIEAVVCPLDSTNEQTAIWLRKHFFLHLAEDWLLDTRLVVVVRRCLMVSSDVWLLSLDLRVRLLLCVVLVGVVVAELSVLFQHFVRVVLTAILATEIVAVVGADLLKVEASGALGTDYAVAVDTVLHALAGVVVDQLVFPLRSGGEKQRLLWLHLDFCFSEVLVVLDDSMTLVFVASLHFSHWYFSLTLAALLRFFDH